MVYRLFVSRIAHSAPVVSIPSNFINDMSPRQISWVLVRVSGLVDGNFIVPQAVSIVPSLCVCSVSRLYVSLIEIDDSVIVCREPEVKIFSPLAAWTYCIECVFRHALVPLVIPQVTSGLLSEALETKSEIEA